MEQQINPCYIPIMDSYYENNAKRLHDVVHQILYKFGGLKEKDLDHYYSIANDVFVDIVMNNRYDSSKCDFRGLLYSSVKNKIISDISKQNADKRITKIEVKDENGNVVLDENGKPKRISVSDIRLDAPIKDGEDTTYGDIIHSNFSGDDPSDNPFHEKVKEYMDNLTETQSNIAKLIMKGYKTKEIKEILKLSDKQYQECWSMMTSYVKKRILFSENNNMEDDNMETMNLIEDVSEKYKNTSYSVASISKQLKNKRVKDNHPLQRYSGQWKSFAKSELISDILRGKSLTQIIISEEIKGGLKMMWLIDGKQRCTTLDDYLHNGFSISKNVKNYNIRYQTNKVDEDGNEILNEEGFPELEWKVFDIRGKRFSQLPEELQDIFKDRQIPVLYNMNCSKKDIAEDIARFNRSRPMNTAQNGWLGLDETFAEFVENIAKMAFFQSDFKGSSYTNNNFISGAIRRIIVEGIMVSDFIEDFRDFDKMCEFLSEEGSDSNFTDFYCMIERLMSISNENIAKLFNAKDSFLWFGLFSRFLKLDIEDGEFIKFLEDFQNNLHSKKIDGESYDDILGSSKSTKNKGIVTKKINHLEKLMNEYFNDSLDGDEYETETADNNIQNSNEEDSVIDCEEFIAENVGVELEEIHKDMDFYNESLDSLACNTIKDGSKLLDNMNRPSLLAMIVYAYKEEEDPEEWLVEFARNNNTYSINQQENYLHMKEDFIKYLDNKKEEAA